MRDRQFHAGHAGIRSISCKAPPPRAPYGCPWEGIKMGKRDNKTTFINFFAKKTQIYLIIYNTSTYTTRVRNIDRQNLQ